VKQAAKAAKAIYATVVAFLSAIGVVLVGDASFSDITSGQWVAAILASVLAGGGVYGITNRQ